MSQREKTQGESEIGSERKEKMISPVTTLVLKSKHNNSAYQLVPGVLCRAQSHSVLPWDALLQIPALLNNSTVNGSEGDRLTSHHI